MALGKKGQMGALQRSFHARMAGQEMEPFEGDEGFPEDGGAESDETLGSHFHRGLEPNRDESESSHLGRIGDQALDNPEPRLANKSKPYGSEDGESPRQVPSRGEKSPGAINDKRLARPENRGGKGLLHSGNPGSDKGVERPSQGRDERGKGVGRLGKIIPAGGYEVGAGRGPKGA